MGGLLVVCGALVRGGRVLAARRSDIDGWEFPGGKVEPGESQEAALRRELAEELGARITTCWLFDEVEGVTEGDEAGHAMTLRCYVCPIGAEVVPQPHEHAELRWVSRADLPDLAWLPADRELALRLGTWWDDVFADSHL